MATLVIIRPCSRLRSASAASLVVQLFSVSVEVSSTERWLSGLHEMGISARGLGREKERWGAGVFRWTGWSLIRIGCNKGKAEGSQNERKNKQAVIAQYQSDSSA